MAIPDDETLKQDLLIFLASEPESRASVPYVAVDISPSRNGFDILIMKENIKSLGDDSKFLRVSDINRIVKGFSASKSIIQTYLRGLF